MNEMKTFKVTCPQCQRASHVRFALANPDQTGSGDVTIHCMFCEQDMIVTLPRSYIAEEHLYKGLNGHPVTGSDT